MNAREQFIRCLSFQDVDRIPLVPGNGRKPTRARWYTEGLPRDVDILPYAYEQAGGTRTLPDGGEGFPLNKNMIPLYERKVLQRLERTQIVQDPIGNIYEISDEFDLNDIVGDNFVTRRWIKCPVETRADWEAMKKRYDPDDPARLPENPAAVAQRLAGRTWPVEIKIAGPFWQVREWLGFETMCLRFHDDPDLIREMFVFWKDFIARLFRNLFRYFVPDAIHISEDMAYKGFSMISPAMIREFLMPAYRQWGGLFRNAGVKIIAVDSDGFIGEIIPFWIEAGFNACDPIEVAAGNDINHFRKTFGRSMAYRGGIDKRCIARGGAVIERELRRIEPVVRDGGYIPGCDHAVPFDVSWPNYVYYIKRLARMTGWL